MTASRWIAAVLGTALLSSGCVSEVGRFSMLADFPVQAVDLPDDVASIAPVEGEDLLDVILVLPLDDPPSIDGALQHALASTDGDVLVDVRVEVEWFYIPLIYGWRGYRVHGKPVRVLHGPDRERTRRSRLLREVER